MELNQEDERAVHRGFFVGICKDHAEVVFERAVKSRVCQGPGCNPIGEMEQPHPGLESSSTQATKQPRPETE